MLRRAATGLDDEAAEEPWHNGTEIPPMERDRLLAEKLGPHPS